MKESQSEHTTGTIRTYVIGFVLSVILTLEAYFAATGHVFSKNGVIALVAILAVVQLVVQLLFFLHLGRGSKPAWNLTVFAFMLLVVGILVIGSLWIMYSLDYNMSSNDMGNYLIQDEGIH